VGVAGDEAFDRFLAQYAPVRPVAGLDSLRLHQAPDLFALWAAFEEMSGAVQAPPFWAVIWPAARVAASYIARRPEIVRGRRVLDWGCGGAAVGCAAALAGARTVIANDIDPWALRCAASNARANRAGIDLSDENLLASGRLPPVDLICVADLFYRRADADPMVELLQRARRRGAEVIVADAERPFAPHAGCRELDRRTAAADPAVEGVDRRIVRLFTLCDKGAWHDQQSS
jgi:predicted nicotinamide N-methyase